LYTPQPKSAPTANPAAALLSLYQKAHHTYKLYTSKISPRKNKNHKLFDYIEIILLYYIIYYIIKTKTQ